MILYSVSSLPAGLSLNTSTGVISRTPTAVTVTDTNSGATTTLDVSIAVVASPRISTQSTNGATAASCTTPALVRGDCGTTYRVVVSAAYCGDITSQNATLTLGVFNYTTGNMGTGRQDDTATLLPNRKVLIVGGNIAIKSAELYNPATRSFSATGSLNTGRWLHTATLLPNDEK